MLISLGVIADELVGVESSSALISRLELLLTKFGVLPARLYLYDATQQMFFSAVGFGCQRQMPDIPAPAASQFPGNFYPLLSAGEWVGLLELLNPPPKDDQDLRQLCLLLAPILVSVHHHQALVEDMASSREEVAKIISAGELLRHLDLDVLLVKILETIMESIHADVGAVLIADEAGHPVPRVAMGLRDEHVNALRLTDGRSVGEAVLATGEPLQFDQQQVSQEMDLGALDGHLTGLLAMPLTARGRSRGVVILANPAIAFDAKQRRVAETVCSLAAIALDNAMLVKATVDRERLQRELDLARTIQAQMFPVGGLSEGSLVIGGASRPCDETGGDYYTFKARTSGTVAMIGDVTGHGLGAALFTTMAHALVQQQLHAGSELDQAFRVLNEGLMYAQTGRFMTAAAVEVAADGTFSYVSAGHNPLIWIRGGDVCWLSSGAMPLGIMPIDHFHPGSPGILQPNDIIVLYTDGFTEATNGANEEFGDERLATVVLAAWREGSDPAGILAATFAAIDAWSGGTAHKDDLTMVVVQRQSAAG